MSRKTQYNPPSSYWREVNKLEDQVRRFSQPTETVAESLSGLLRSVTRTREAAWQGSQSSTYTYWRNDKIVFTGVSSLVLGTRINVDPAAEGLPLESSEITTGEFRKELRYITGWFPCRQLVIGYGYTPHIENPAMYRPNAPTQESRRMDREAGITVPTEQDYEIILAELRRGATGDYALEASS